MTAPVGGNVGETLEAMWNAVVDLFFVGIGLIVCFADTLGDNLRVALLVASVLAVGALHTGSVLEEVAAEGATHDVVELLGDELVALLLVNLLLLLTNCTLTVETDIEWPAVLQLLGYRLRQYNRSATFDQTYRNSLTGRYDQLAPARTTNRS